MVLFIKPVLRIMINHPNTKLCWCALYHLGDGGVDGKRSSVITGGSGIWGIKALPLHQKQRMPQCYGQNPITINMMHVK